MEPSSSKIVKTLSYIIREKATVKESFSVTNNSWVLYRSKNIKETPNKVKKKPKNNYKITFKWFFMNLYKI